MSGPSPENPLDAAPDSASRALLASALHVSTETGQPEFVEALVECFGIPDHLRGHYKVVRLAASLGHDAIIRILAAHGCYLGSIELEWDPSPLLCAIAHNHPSTVQSLLELGQPMEDPLTGPLEERFKKGQFPIKRGNHLGQAGSAKKIEILDDELGSNDSRSESSESDSDTSAASPVEEDTGDESVTDLQHLEDGS